MLRKHYDAGAEPPALRVAMFDGSIRPRTARKKVETNWQHGASHMVEGVMMSRRKKQLTLLDVVRIVSEFSRNDTEANLTVADLLNRGVVRIDARGHTRRIVVR